MSCARKRTGAPAWRMSERAWACQSPSDRLGDIDQVNAIAWALDPDYRKVDLAAEFERLRQEQADTPQRQELPRLPRFIVGIGRKRVEHARIIRGWSRGQTKLVHIGRMRGPLSDIDYLVTTPAYPAPPSPKVLCLDIAVSDRIRRLLAGRANLALVSGMPGRFSESGIRPNWINVFIGNPLRGEGEGAVARLRTLAKEIDRLAARYDKDVVISGAPRTHAELYDALGATLTCRHHLYRWRPGDDFNPFEVMVRHSRQSIVTSDSVSMISQLVAAAHQVLIFPWRARAAPLEALFTGLLPRSKPGGKDIAGFCNALCARKLAAELNESADFEAVRPRPGIQDELFRKLVRFVQ